MYDDSITQGSNFKGVFIEAGAYDGSKCIYKMFYVYV